MTINATPAKPIYYKISVRQMLHQTITLTRLDTGETTTTIFNVLKGTRILVEVRVDDGYIPGELNVDQYFYANDIPIISSFIYTSKLSFCL